MFVDKQICCQDSLTESLGNGWPQRGVSTFLMAWKLLNANEKQRLFVYRVRTEGLMFLHHVGRISSFFLETVSTVLLWLLIKHRDGERVTDTSVTWTVGENAL